MALISAVYSSAFKSTRRFKCFYHSTKQAEDKSDFFCVLCLPVNVALSVCLQRKCRSTPGNGVAVNHAGWTTLGSSLQVSSSLRATGQKGHKASAVFG